MQDIGLGWNQQRVISDKTTKWFPILKGGPFRKWYGNNFYVVNWLSNGQEIKDNVIRNYGGGSYTKEVRSEDRYFNPGITWTVVATNRTGFRRYGEGFIFSSSGGSITIQNNDVQILNYLTGLLNSCYAEYALAILSPTMGFASGYIGLVPTPKPLHRAQEVSRLVSDCISLSRADWDAFETSWDFARHPLLVYGCDTIEEAFDLWRQDCDARFARLKANEEELNRIFIDIYGLQSELTPEVDDRDVTVRRADLGRDIRSFLSYFVGCMFGRYSLHKPGLLFAGEPYSLQAFVEKLNDQPGVISSEELAEAQKHGDVRYSYQFDPVNDNVIPITDTDYFENDIITRLTEFLRIAYGKDTLESNLDFIAHALGGKGDSRTVIRSYFMNDFFKDHCRVYQKHPIYWLFDSGKQGGFRALVYMHRWRSDTIATVRTEYVSELQSRYDNKKKDNELRIQNASGSERMRLTKQMTRLQAQIDELTGYWEKISHLADQMVSIDLDDGVKVNYGKFNDVLAPIR